MTDEFDALRLVVGVGFFAYASMTDLRTRRVPNATWLALGALALVILAAEVATVGSVTLIDVAVDAAVIVLAYLLWKTHLIAGGADAKALMVLAILVPAPIAWTWIGVGLPLWGASPMPAALVVFMNALVVFVLVPFGLFAVNLARGGLSLPAMFVGYRMPLAKARQAKVWIMDRVGPDGRVRRQWMPSRLGPDELEVRAAQLERVGAEHVWVTPKIPFMVPLLLGFVAAFVVGDVLFRILSFALA